MLMTGARQAGLSPGTRYASTVAVAMVTADRALRSPTTVRPAAALTGARGPTDDPLLAVARALDHDAEAARAWLLAPLPGADGRLVVEQLVAGRYRSMDPGAAATSFAATAQLVTATGGDPARRDTVLLDAAFLGAVGSEALSTPEPDAYRAALAPALGDVGTVLARHPDAVTAVLDDSAGGGVDAGAVLDADRLTRPGRSPGTWEAVLPDRSTAAALVGVVALDTGALTDRSSGTAPREPAAAPALSQVLWALDTRLEADLVDAVRADRSGDPHALDAVARRLGETVGFTLTSAGEGLARRDADVDDRNRVLAGLAEAAAGKVVLPGAGRLATPLVRLAADRLVDATLPTDSAAAQRRATTQATDERCGRRQPRDPLAGQPGPPVDGRAVAAAVGGRSRWRAVLGRRGHAAARERDDDRAASGVHRLAAGGGAEPLRHRAGGGPRRRRGRGSCGDAVRVVSHGRSMPGARSGARSGAGSGARSGAGSGARSGARSSRDDRVTGRVPVLVVPAASWVTPTGTRGRAPSDTPTDQPIRVPWRVRSRTVSAATPRERAPPGPPRGPRPASRPASRPPMRPTRSRTPSTRRGGPRRAVRPTWTRSIAPGTAR